MRIRHCILIILVVAGCGDGGGSATDVLPSPLPPAQNSAPTISGTPQEQVVEGKPYLFEPSANDADGDELVFLIENQPSWTSFNTSNGSLSGTPAASDIGTTAGVAISVSDDLDSASLPPFDLEVLEIQTGSATVSWDIPTTNADGSNLDDLGGFNVHYGTKPGGYTGIAVINDDSATSILIENLQPGTWYFAVSAFDLSGNQSALSTEVSKSVNR